MSTIKFVPMEFFAQFALTQMRRLQARGAVGAAFSGAGRGWWAQVAVCTAFPARGAYCERWALSARLFGCVVAVGGRRSPLAGMRRCRRARGAVGAAFSSTGTSLADVESCWWAQVAVCTAFPARGAYCERWALSARLFLVRGRRWWAQVAACGHEALSAGAGCCRRGFFEHGNIIGGCGELLVGAGRCLRTQKRRWRGFFGCGAGLVGAGRCLYGFPGAGCLL